MRKLEKLDRQPDHYWFYDTPNRIKLYFRVGIEHGGEIAIQWQ